MDEGWMPEAETKARARAAAYNPNSQAAAKAPNSRRKREGMDVAVFDEDRRKAGINRLYRVRFKRVWGVDPTHCFAYNFILHGRPVRNNET